MKPIRIYTPDIDLLGEISNYESNMFTRSWHGVGTLELRINRHKLYTETLQKGNVIVIGNDPHKAYLIVYRGVELNEQGKISEDWHIIAHQLKAVVGRRITMPPSHTSHDNKSGAAETVIKHYIDRNIVNPVDGRRKIPQLAIAPDLQRGMHIDWQSRFKNLAEETADISLLSGIGWDVYVDYESRKWVFDVYEGKDLSVDAQDRKIRYIRDWATGNSVNAITHWLEVKAINKAGINVALNKAVIPDQIFGANYNVITDGNTTSPYYSGGSATKNVVIDLGDLHDVEQVQVWHYYNDGRTYFGTKTEVSRDGVNWITLFDSAVDGTYAETVSGKTHIVPLMDSDISPVVFSPQFGNIKDMQFVDSDLNYRNVAVVAGQGEGVDRRVIEVGQSSGLDRYEVFVDARDVSEETDDEEPVQRPIADIVRDLTNRGNQQLAEMSQEIYLEGQILTGGPFKYEQDWHLGDIPTLQNKDWGTTLDSRITEVTEVYERETGMQLSVVFGQSRPTLISKIKQELSGMRNEIVK